jgi:hypothetical protein
MRIAVLVVELGYGLDETAAVAASRLAHSMIAVRKIVDCKDLRTGCVSEVAPAMMEGAEAEQLVFVAKVLCYAMAGLAH